MNALGHEMLQPASLPKFQAGLETRKQAFSPSNWSLMSNPFWMCLTSPTDVAFVQPYQNPSGGCRFSGGSWRFQRDSVRYHPGRYRVKSFTLSTGQVDHFVRAIKAWLPCEDLFTCNQGKIRSFGIERHHREDTGETKAGTLSVPPPQELESVGSRRGEIPVAAYQHILLEKSKDW